MDKELAEIKQKVKRELSDFLGISPGDIEDDTFFSEDLHMNPTDIADFTDILDKAGFDVGELDFSEIETFLELVEALNDKH